jgi:16S rRNA (guanine527-N7)-methyltransferase
MPLEEPYLRLIARAVPRADSAPVLGRLSMLYDLVLQTNERMNITSLTSPIDVTLKHIIDSLSLFSHPLFSEAAQNPTICDIGCGGGFPGLPVACVRPTWDLTMIDSTEKKITALGENARHLGLERIVPLWGRGEELAAAKAPHRERYDIAVSRAVASLPVLCELCLPFVKKGGYFVAMKGAKAVEELENSRRCIPQLGGVLKEIVSLSWPQGLEEVEGLSPEEREEVVRFTQAYRYLIVIEKKKNTPPVYPRSWAKMTKSPL